MDHQVSLDIHFYMMPKVEERALMTFVGRECPDQATLLHIHDSDQGLLCLSGPSLFICSKVSIDSVGGQ